MSENTYHQPAASKRLLAYPSSGLHRGLFKAPIFLWRLGLGPLIGRVLMLITHTGRRSGLPRRTMVEYHALAGVKYAPCAFGPRSDWVQNILADPRVTIQTASGAESMLAMRVTTDQELLDVYRLFRRRDPPLFKLYMQSLGVQDNPTDVLANKERIFWLRFDPTDQPTPPPLDADLAWILPAAIAGLSIYWVLSRQHRRPA